MTPEYVVKLGQDSMMLVLMIGGPILIVALVVGLGVSIFQAVTQIHEMTLTFIPKIVAVGVTILFILPWMMQQVVDFTHRLISSIPVVIG